MGLDGSKLSWQAFDFVTNLIDRRDAADSVRALSPSGLRRPLPLPLSRFLPLAFLPSPSLSLFVCLFVCLSVCLFDSRDCALSVCVRQLHVQP